MWISLLGYGLLILLGWLCSKARTKIRWRTVIGAVALQFCFGALVLYVPQGKAALQELSNLVATVIAYGDEGIRFLFGNDLSSGSGSLGFVFAFKVLPVIIFFFPDIGSLLPQGNATDSKASRGGISKLPGLAEQSL